MPLVESVKAGGLESAYERVGAGPLLVLVHGAGDDSRIWQPQLAGLADEFTVVAWDEPGAGRSGDLPEGFELSGYADALAALIETIGLGAAHVAGLSAGLSWGDTVALELYRRHPALVQTLIMIDTYAGWKGSLPPGEVAARVAAARRMLAAPHEQFDPTLPGLFAADPPPQFVALLAAVAADVRPATMRRQVAIMAEADLSDLLPYIAVPTLLIWGQMDGRSPLTVAYTFQQAIADTELVVIDGAGHLSNLERPEQVNDAIRAFCRAHLPHAR
jgi:pimeloyl-ACP methyl ester carboxylesterase